jgi:colicin import membrane protein
MSTVIKPERKVTPPPPDDPWYYGYRDIHRRLPDGTLKHERIPLTLEDTLHPQEGDVIMESDLHNFLRSYLGNVFRWRTKDDPEALILSDTGIYWDDPKLPYTNHSPDIAAIFGVKNRKPEYPSFSVAKEGVRPRLIIELVSLNNRANDIDTKVHEYHELEIKMYVIADRQRIGDPWKLIGYLWRPDEYQNIPTDMHGRLWLDAVRLWLGADGTRLVCYDRDGKEIGFQATVGGIDQDRLEVEKQRDTEKQRADAAEAKAKELEAELARLRGQ